MRRLQRFILRLYPAQWRIRYGGEMVQLLNDTNPGLDGAMNLFFGALQLQFTRQSFWKMAILWTMLCATLGWGASFLVTPIYVSTARFRLDALSPDDDPAPKLAKWMANIYSRPELHILLTWQKLNLYPGEKKDPPSEQLLDRVRADLSIQQEPSESPKSIVFRMSFTYPDAKTARDTVRQLTQQLLEVGRLDQLSQPSESDAFRHILTALAQVEQRIAKLEKKSGIIPSKGKPEANPLDKEIPLERIKDILELSSEEPTKPRSPVDSKIGVSEMFRAYRTMNDSVPLKAPDAGLTLLEAAGLPQEPLTPNRLLCMETGAGIGFLFASILWGMQQLGRTTKDLHAA